MQRVRFRVDLSAACSIGPGKIALLEGIRDTGSLSATARALGMSYRRAWLLLDELNRSFTTALTTASVGGRGGGGVSLTPFGLEVIAAYRGLETAVEALAGRKLAAIERAAVTQASAAPRSAGVVGSAKGRGRAAKRP